jgi:hypothetical protein
MPQDPNSLAPDELGSFLRKYGEYLDGSRSYSDLPIPTAAEVKRAAENLQQRDSTDKKSR